MEIASFHGFSNEEWNCNKTEQKWIIWKCFVWVIWFSRYSTCHPKTGMQIWLRIHYWHFQLIKLCNDWNLYSDPPQGDYCTPRLCACVWVRALRLFHRCCIHRTRIEYWLCKFQQICQKCWLNMIGSGSLMKIKLMTFLSERKINGSTNVSSSDIFDPNFPLQHSFHLHFRTIFSFLLRHSRVHVLVTDSVQIQLMMCVSFFTFMHFLS